MKKIILFLLCVSSLTLQAQIGLKAGVNFANITKASAINSSSNTGFHAGVFLAPPSSGVMGYRTEIIFSRQGYNYETNSNTGTVDLDYIFLPQMTAINITKFVQLQFGGQIGFLLNAKVDSSKTSTTPGTGYDLMDKYNRIDYGLAGGIEIHPVSGLLIGARYNVGLGKLYKHQQEQMNQPPMPSFIPPKVDTKNNVIQIFLGWHFIKNTNKNKKSGS